MPVLLLHVHISVERDYDDDEDDTDNDDRNVVVGGPYSGATDAHRWVPPIHKMEPPPDYREHNNHQRF